MKILLLLLAMCLSCALSVAYAETLEFDCYSDNGAKLTWVVERTNGRIIDAATDSVCDEGSRHLRLSRQHIKYSCQQTMGAIVFSPEYDLDLRTGITTRRGVLYTIEGTEKLTHYYNCRLR